VGHFRVPSKRSCAFAREKVGHQGSLQPDLNGTRAKVVLDKGASGMRLYADFRGLGDHYRCIPTSVFSRKQLKHRRQVFPCKYFGCQSAFGRRISRITESRIGKFNLLRGLHSFCIVNFSFSAQSN